MKKKLFASIAIVSLAAVFISLILMMVLTPSFKEIINKEAPSLEERHSNISTDFILKTTKNTKVSTRKFRGKFLFIYFGSTYCPSISLPHIIEMQNVLQRLDKKHTKGLIEFLFITADPVKDTQQHMQDYFKKFDARIIPLTGDEESINETLKNFKVYDMLFKEKENANPEAEITVEKICTITTSPPFYFIGKDGELIKHYNPHSTSLGIAKDILHYIKIS